MFDTHLRPLIAPPLQRLGVRLARAGATADGVTLVGFALGLAAAGAVAMGAFGAAAGLFIAGRLADGLDGAIAQATAKTDRGGYLDIVLDFTVYAAMPLAFAVHAPATNALAAATLLAAIVVNGGAFLAFAIMAERRGLTSAAQGEKSLYFLAGLAEGAETIAVYVLACLFPSQFPLLAYAFAALCVLSAGGRVVMAWRLLR